ncbi:MAG TPA: hypothetical protein VGU73_12025 [Acidimicrobiia bacterium]|nr:hypothetical protein [Acidimicrobiia bacterium]
MALRDKLKERVQPLLEPGEQVQEVWFAQSGPNPNWLFLTWLTLFYRRYWIGATTTNGVVVFHVKSQVAPMQPVAVAQRLPRGTHVGPLAGSLWSKASFTIDGKPLWVPRRFYKDIERADAAA